jgi:RNA polymerase sigma factor (sigma-70 family)
VIEVGDIINKVIYEKGYKFNADFDDIFNKYKYLCVSLAKNFCDKYRFLDYNDVLQESYIGLWKSFELYNPDLKIGFGYFSKRVIIHVILKYIRQKQFYYERHSKCISIFQNVSDDENIILADKLEDDINIEESITLNLCIKNNLSKLNKKEKLILSLRQQGLTQSKIANKVGLSQVQISRKLNKIKQLLLN